VDGGGWGLRMMVMMLVFWGLVIVGIVLVIKCLTTPGRGATSDQALDVLRERYARGEITRDEFEAAWRSRRRPRGYRSTMRRTTSARSSVQRALRSILKPTSRGKGARTRRQGAFPKAERVGLASNRDAHRLGAAKHDRVAPFNSLLSQHHERDLVRRRVEEVDQRLKDLMRIRDDLRALLKSWRSTRGTATVCPHIEHASRQNERRQ